MVCYQNLSTSPICLEYVCPTFDCLIFGTKKIGSQAGPPFFSILHILLRFVGYLDLCVNHSYSMVYMKLLYCGTSFRFVVCFKVSCGKCRSYRLKSCTRVSSPHWRLLSSITASGHKHFRFYMVLDLYI